MFFNHFDVRTSEPIIRVNRKEEAGGLKLKGYFEITVPTRLYHCSYIVSYYLTNSDLSSVRDKTIWVAVICFSVSHGF